MRRALALILFIVLVGTLFPGALAEEYLEEVTEGRFVTVNADNGLSYYADFYLSSVSTLAKNGDDLVIGFTLGQIWLKDFFSNGRLSRILMFRDGRFVSGEDFDAEGNFTGEYFSGAEGVKKNQDRRIEYAENPEAFFDYVLQRSSGGINVLKDGMTVYGDEKQRCIEKYTELYGETGYIPDRFISNRFIFTENEDGSLSAVRQEIETAEGYRIVCSAPETVCVIGAREIIAHSPGRAVLNYSNIHGDNIVTMSIKAEQAGGELVLNNICPCCGENTGEEIHLAPCGHYICESGYDGSHSIPECGIAGHCCVSDMEHGRCKNCQGYLCDGKMHGQGHCKHVHQWFVTAIVPSADGGRGTTVSTCFTCGQTLTQNG